MLSLQACVTFHTLYLHETKEFKQLSLQFTSIHGEEGDEGAEVVRGSHRGKAPSELGEHQHLPGLEQNSAKIDLWQGVLSQSQVTLTRVHLYPFDRAISPFEIPVIGGITGEDSSWEAAHFFLR